MTASTPALARPSVGTIRLRNGENVVTITGGPHRVLVRREHLAVLLDDLDELAEEDE